MKNPIRRALQVSMVVLACTVQTGHAQGLHQDLYQGVTTVEVFANASMLITPGRLDPVQLTIYRLDGLRHVEAMINQSLPRDEAQAMAYVREQLPRIRRQVEPMALNAANGMRLSQHYRIDRLPAMVINGHAVLFGYTDVHQALARYQQHMRGKQGGSR